MMDEETPENAALCHLEIAHIYEKMANWSLQRKNLLKAGRLFLESQKRRSLMQYTVYSDMKNMFTDCYLRAIDITMREGFLISAGVYSVELGVAVMDLGDFTNAYEHLTRAHRLLQNDYYCHLNASSKLVYCTYNLGKYEEALMLLDDLWADSMKRQPLSTLGKQVIVQTEINTVLVLMKSQRSADGRHKLLLQSFEKDFGDNADSILSEYEFTIIKNFLIAIRENNISMARQIFAYTLKKMMDGTGQRVAVDILDSLPYVATDTTSTVESLSIKDLKTRRQKIVAGIRERVAQSA
ncbi:hypothetical protein L596_015085 [Steinernema carpocapsae]|uniref:Uncharacterized protein n=1 Tax=Steinernema carpocapsae TaxID=34508 RepID=A0A4U5NF67_STECR|nr:hypothetical protein L596_015085 [Steinernema carpocapsae]